MWYKERFLPTTALLGFACSCLLSLSVTLANAQVTITGTVNVPPSSVDGRFGLEVGDGVTDGTLNISAGEEVRIGADVIIGQTGANGTVNITDNGIMRRRRPITSLEIGTQGTLTISTGGELRVNQNNLTLRNGGTINIGAATGDPAAAAGRYRTRFLTFEDGATVFFNSTSTGGRHLDTRLISTASGDGDIFFEEGTIELNRNNNLFSGTMAVDAGANVHFTRTIAAGGAQFEFTGGSITAVGNTTVSGDILVIDGPEVHDANFVTSSANFTLAGIISGVGAVRFTGDGITTLTGNNSWTGGTTIDGTEVVFSSASNLGTSDIDLINGHLTFNGSTATISNLIDLTGVSSIEVGTGDTLTASNDVSGGGELRKLGAGTLVLSGAGSSFSGGLDLADGTVQFGAAANVGSGTISFSGGDLSFVSGSDATIANNIEMNDDGTLDVAPGRILTLTGDIIDGGAAGSLSIGSGGTADLQGSNTFSGGLVIFEDSTVAFSDVDSLGTGFVILIDGNLSYTGSSGLDLARLVLADGTSNTIDISDNSVDLEISSDLSGTGALAIDGGNSTTLSGSNALWNGALSVTDTELIFNAAENVGNGSLAITLNSSVLTFTGDSEVTLTDLSFSGSGNEIGTTDAAGIINLMSGLTGSDPILITGPGEVDLRGNNSGYSADIEISSGTVGLLGFSTANSGSGNVIVDGGRLLYLGGGTEFVDTTKLQVGNASNVFDIDQYGARLIWTGSIAPGGGTFEKDGVGKLVLSDGTKSLVDSTINEGILQVGLFEGDNSTLDSDLIINTGGKLTGSGTVDGNVTLNGGSISPGASFGTITIGGLDATGSGGSLIIDAGSDPISGTLGADQIQILSGGSVDLTGIDLKLIHVEGPNMVRIGNVFVIIDNLSPAGTEPVTGVFSSVDDDMFMLDVRVLYGIPGDANDVAIQFIRNSNNFDGLAETRNEYAVTSGLDTIDESGELFYQLAPLNDKQIMALLTPLAGEIHASTRAILLNDSRFLRQAVNDRLYQAHSAFASELDENMVSHRVGPYEMWGQVYGSWGTFFTDGNARTTDRNVGGLFVGVDVGLYERARAGLMAGFGRTSILINSIDADSNSDSYSVGGYASVNPIWDVELRGGVAGTWYNISTNRKVVLHPEEMLTSDQFVSSVQVFGELGYNFESTYGDLEPFIGVAYAYLSGPGFNETGGVAALRASGQSDSLTFMTLGARGEFDLSNYLYGETSFVGVAAWQHASAKVLTSNQGFIDSGNPFVVASVPIGRNVALLETGLQTYLTDNVLFNVNYYGLIASEAQDHGANARLLVRF